MNRYYTMDNLIEMEHLLRKLHKIVDEIDDLHRADLISAIQSDFTPAKERSILAELLVLRKLERNRDGNEETQVSSEGG